MALSGPSTPMGRMNASFDEDMDSLAALMASAAKSAHKPSTPGRTRTVSPLPVSLLSTHVAICDCTEIERERQPNARYDVAL